MLKILPLTPADIPAARRLSDAANWNHLDTDWRRLITLWPDTCLAGWLDDTLIATATLAVFAGAQSPSDHLAWVGVMLVDVNHRGAGHGGAMFDAILQSGALRGLTNFGLDATDMGRPLYAKRNFKDLFPIHRWKCPAPAAPQKFPENIRPMNDRDWPALLELDRQASNLDRSLLLKKVAAEPGVAILIAETANTLAGFAVLRPGRIASYIGPLLAVGGDTRTAAALLNAALAHDNNPALPIFLDAVDTSAFRPALDAANFQIARTLTRMSRGPQNHPFAYSPQTFAIAGLELC